VRQIGRDGNEARLPELAAADGQDCGVQVDIFVPQGEQLSLAKARHEEHAQRHGCHEPVVSRRDSPERIGRVLGKVVCCKPFVGGGG
jgi:hypothetical protein